MKPEYRPFVYEDKSKALSDLARFTNMNMNENRSMLLRQPEKDSTGFVIATTGDTDLKVYAFAINGILYTPLNA
jgi:hypothetical protein